MSGRYDYVRYDEDSVIIQAGFKDRFITLEAMVDRLPASRARSLAHTKLEEAYMWIGKAIRDSQVEVDSLDLPGRSAA